MGKETGIEYCDASWSPWQGCHKVDPEGECKNCYMYRDKKRFGQDPTKVIRSKQKTFEMPLKLKAPAKIFVCYDEETEILTETGWRYIKEVNCDDKVATLNQNTNFLEYQNPIRCLMMKYKGKTYKLQTKVLDLLVTENHRMYVAFKGKGGLGKRNSFKFNLIPASKVIGKQVFYKRDLIWEGDDIKYFYLKGKEMKSPQWYLDKSKGQQSDVSIPIKLWLKFLGFYLAEGWVTSSRFKEKRGGYKIVIGTNVKDKWQQEMIDCVKGLCAYLGRKYHVSKDGRIGFGDNRIGMYLKGLGKSGQKYIPREYLNLSKELLGILLNALIKGDGSRLKSKCLSYYYATVSRRLANDVQELAIKCGYTSIMSTNKSRQGIFIKENRIIKSQKSYRVSVCSSTKMPEIYNKRRKGNIEGLIDYDGYVYCVEVPNSVVYVRRNGKPVWCGNCSWSDFFIKEADPWRIEAMEIMAAASQHTYIIVTKRPERAVKCLYDLQGGFFGAGDYYPNWWFLVTAGTQKSADARVPEIMRLRNISLGWPVIGVSVEPMLESMDLSSYLPYLDWTILGGESGPHARPTHPDWVQSVRDQCQKAQVPFFFKQWGQWCPDDFETVTETGLIPKRCWIGNDGRIYDWFPGISSTKQMMWRSRKTAGRSIDGRIWAEMPAMGSNEATERTNSQKT